MSARKLFSLVGMTTATTGTGSSLTLGVALPRCRTFAQAGVPDGTTVRYFIKDGSGAEEQLGVYTAAGLLLSRAETPVSSTNGGAQLSLSGSAQIIIDAGEADFRQFYADDGTAAAPSIASASAPDRGLFFPAGAVALSVAGVEVWRASALGIGIGGPPSVVALTVKQIGTAPVFRLYDAAGGVRLNFGGAYNLALNNAAGANNTQLPSDGTTVAFINAQGGNVGVGTITPAYLFDIGNGAGQVVARINGGNSGAAGGPALFLGYGGVNKSAVGAYSSIFGGAFNDALTLYTNTGKVLIPSGDVGIGVSPDIVLDNVAATRPVTVAGASSAATVGSGVASLVILNKDTTANNTTSLIFAALTGASLNQFASAEIVAIHGPRTNDQYPTGEFAFLTSSALNSAPTEKVRIAKNGNLGLGTTTPLYKLDAHGIINTDTALRMAPAANVGGNSRATLQANYNLDNTGASVFLWNYSNGAGELDLFINRNGGGSGGLHIYDFPNTSGDPVQLFKLTGNGTVVLPQYTNVGTIGNKADGTLVSSGFVTPQLYGCACDGITDDTAKFSDCLNSGKPIFFSGKIRVTSNITVNLTTANQGLYLAGGGRSLSEILLDGANVKIVVNIANMDSPWGVNTEVVTLKDFCIVPKSTSNQAAIEFNGQAAGIGSNEPTGYIQNVHVMPDTTSHYTAYGFKFFDMRQVTVTGCILSGLYGGYNGSAVYWGGAAGSAPVTLNISECTFSHWNIGLELAPNTGGVTSGANDWQGIFVNTTIFLANHIGINATTIDGFGALLVAHQCHFNFRYVGVYADSISNLKLTDNDFLPLGGGGPSTIYAILNTINRQPVAGAQFGVISGNSVNGNALSATTRYAIYMAASVSTFKTFVHSNSCSNCNGGFVISGGAYENVVADASV